MHSFNNITFTCFSESTFAETAYHWYLNGTKTIAGILKEMPGNQTFGYLTLTNLSKDAYVTVTCRWHYRHSFVDQRSISASLWTIPQVTLSSPGASSLYSVVKYSCISTVKNADVHVAVVPLSYKNVSYSVNKGNYEGHFIIWNDTKIFCFANYNGQRGIIQERVVLVRPVNASLLDGVGVIMHSFSNITFSCFTNRTSLNNTYKWYLNGNPITTGISERTLGNKVYGYLTSTNLNQNATVKITCKLFYSNTIVAERSINISIPSIPQVRLTSLNTSSLYSEVNYSCDSNRPNADVYVAVVPLHLKDISYSVQKASYTGRFTISNDTKIFCFATYNDQRGIIQEHVIYALPVNASLLDGVGVIMHSFSNITFSCFSNRTSLNNTYEWYLNGNLITTGISKRTLGNKIYGYLTLTNINQTARVNITCKLFYSNTIVAERSINISIPSIPQVRLTSLNTSSLYSEVNYSCDSNLANADVYVAVVPLHLKDISYSVQKARYTGRFTISNDTKIFCFANYNGQRGIIQEHVIHALPVKAPLLDGVGVIMHSFSNITFSCFSNRTSLNNTYEWYLNGNLITTGISKRTLGNKIYGYLTLTNINQNARVNITCKLFYSNTIVAERSINISIPSIPQVRLTSLNTSSLYSEVNYSCDSNLASADVYVAVVPLHLNNISYSVQKARYTGRFTIWNDTKIFCFANYDGQRGIIQEHVIHALPVKAPLLDGVGVIMHSFSNITFSCFSNRTSLNNTYKWYLNGNPITTGISNRTLGNKIYGYLTLTNISPNARDKITCRLFYGNIFVNERSINTSIDSFPQVSLNSPNVSSIYSKVNYSCVSSLPNADVYVAVVPFHYKTISYSVQKAKYSGNFTIQQDMKIFCYANHNGVRGIIKQNVVFLREVQKFTIQRITTTMHSDNNRTFTCYANSTAARITYEWYVNGSRLTAGIKQSTVQNESLSELSLTNLSRNYFAIITCRTFYRTLFMDDQNITTDIASIPQVTINSQNLSLSNSVVNYNCYSNVRNADVYATAVPSTHKTVSYPAAVKGNVTGHFTMVNETKIFCYAEYGNKRGIIKSKTVYLLEIARFSILKITTKQSVNSITFTSRTDSNLTNLIHKWYFNNIDITTKMTQMMVNGKSQSEVTLSDLEENNSDTITCEVFYQTLRIDKKKIYTSISSIPQVTVNVFPMSLVGYSVNYSCKSSVKNSNVHVTVEYPGSSKSYTNVSSYMGRFQMVDDTKISCYAEGDGRRGIIKEKMVTLAKVEEFLITQITTTMHSIDNITFACYTNSSSTAITYKWYFNNSIITSGKKQMLLNRQSVGFLTLSNLRPKDKGLVTCEAYFKILRIAKKQIDFSVSTIPRVTLTSVQVANINTPVVYSCTSSVNNADVYVSSPNTKSINPDQSRSSYNGKFTIISDTKISCYSKHNLLQGPVVETTVFASKGEKSCEEET
ncbi:uncharacterized protein LOC115210917 [Octopus sinensis]|uniref:Uncharacterized protein LOC115210917 n=1 Tax=Octopus sinensis TaxID=2607531 RepID=A0A6P7SC42_9MOLL|nr:uncharacterized protein LOC115210917 [Octopus sinensis]